METQETPESSSSETSPLPKPLSLLAPINDRITVVERVYHQIIGEQATSVESRYSFDLETTEQPYKRIGSIGDQEWEPLDFGWLGTNVGLILLSNEEGKYLQTNPTEEEQAETAQRVIEVSFQAGESSWIVPPRQSMRVMLSPYRSCLPLIRCRKGRARYVLHAFPS
jgi:hypothetical protein